MTDNIGIDEEIIPIKRQQDIKHTVPPLPPEAITNVVKKKIIKDGRIGIEVKHLEKAKIQIDSLVKELGGYYANEKLETWSTEIKYNLKLRIPNSKFEELITNIDNGYGKDSIQRN